MVCGIVTIVSNNYGNRLQNYALQTALEKLNISCETLQRNRYETSIMRYIKVIIKTVIKHSDYLFRYFDLQIKWSKYHLADSVDTQKLVKDYDYFIAGSDQIWNPTFHFTSKLDFLTFARPEQRIAYAASIGVSKLPENCIKEYIEYFNGIPHISVREQSAADIIKEYTGRDVPVLIDPTMLLTKEEWLEVARKSKHKPAKKYIFKYFLGVLTSEYDEYIENIAIKDGCEIVDILKENSGGREAFGPAGFVSLIANSAMVCTDSFHGTIFSILFSVPFVVFDRPIEKGYGKMSARIDTLLKTFKFQERVVYSIDDLSKDYQKCNFKHVDSILKFERKKSNEFLKNALKLEQKGNIKRRTYGNKPT